MQVNLFTIILSMHKKIITQDNSFSKPPTQKQSFHQYACIKNIEPNLSLQNCLKLLKNHFPPKFQYNQLYKPPGKSFLLIKFNSEQDCCQFKKSQIPQKKKWKVKDAFLKSSDIKRFISVQKIKNNRQNRNQQKQVNVQQMKKQYESVDNTDIRDIITPLWKLQYAQQIKIKQKEFKQILSRIPSAQLKAFHEYKIKPYRNKIQLTIGLNSKGKIAVGFNKGKFENKTTMIDYKYSQIFYRQVDEVINKIQSWLQEMTLKGFKEYSKYTHLGQFRYVVIRFSQRTKQMLVILVVSSQDLQSNQITQIQQSFKTAMQKNQYITSLSILYYNQKADSIPFDKPKQLYGENGYEQIICDKKFWVSSPAFLQGCTQMSQILYRSISEQVKDCQVILDLYCGIGTIGLSLNKTEQTKIIGIEIIPSACQDAVKNAQNNKLQYDVICGKVQDNIKKLCQKYQGKKIVAIVDPPRAGLHRDIVKILRTTKGLDNIIYIACNPKGIVDNILDLTLESNKKRKGPRFLLKTVEGYDLFPLTKHYEGMFILQRSQNPMDF